MHYWAIRTIVGLLLLAPLLTFGQAANGSKRLKFDKAAIYDFEGRKGRGLFIVEHGKLSSSISKQKILSNSEADTMLVRLYQKASYGGLMAECFDPHLGIVYYSKDSMVAHITVCLDCNRISMSMQIPGLQQGRTATADEIYYMQTGMSKSFRKFLNGLILKYGFSHPIKPGSIAD